MSADPLAVHAPGEADLNVYAYVHGSLLSATDPVGLDEACKCSQWWEAPSAQDKGKGGEQQVAETVNRAIAGSALKQSQDISSLATDPVKEKATDAFAKEQVATTAERRKQGGGSGRQAAQASRLCSGQPGLVPAVGCERCAWRRRGGVAKSALRVGGDFLYRAAASRGHKSLGDAFSAFIADTKGSIRIPGTTEPTLPPKTIAEEGDVKIDHYYRSGDHPPAHAHVTGGGTATKIGPNGKPIAGEPELSATQQAAVDANRSIIRSAINKIGRWLSFKEQE